MTLPDVILETVLQAAQLLGWLFAEGNKNVWFDLKKDG